MQRWAKILGKKGWLATAGRASSGAGWTAVQNTGSIECAARRRAASCRPSAGVMAPVISAVAFGTPELSALPSRASPARGLVEPGQASRARVRLASLKPAERQGDKYIVNGQEDGTTLPVRRLIFCLVRTDSRASRRPASRSCWIDMKSPGVSRCSHHHARRRA